MGELLSHQPREQCARRGGRPHLDDGRGALRRRRGRRLLAGDLRQADRRVHRHGQPERGGHPDGLWRDRPGVGGFLAAPRHRGRRGAGREPAHALRHGGGVQVGHQVGGQGRPRRSGARLRAPRLHPAPLRPPGSGAAHHPARSRRVRGGRASLRAGEGLALRSRPGRRAERRAHAPRRQGPAVLRGRGRPLRGCDSRAPAARRAGAGAGADDAQGQGRLPREPPAVGRACAARSPSTS